MATSYTTETKPSATSYDKGPNDYLLQEIGDFLLLEDGGKMIIVGMAEDPTPFTEESKPSTSYTKESKP